MTSPAWLITSDPGWDEERPPRRLADPQADPEYLAEMRQTLAERARRIVPTFRRSIACGGGCR